MWRRWQGMSIVSIDWLILSSEYWHWFWFWSLVFIAWYACQPGKIVLTVCSCRKCSNAPAIIDGITHYWVHYWLLTRAVAVLLAVIYLYLDKKTSNKPAPILVDTQRLCWGVFMWLGVFVLYCCIYCSVFRTERCPWSDSRCLLSMAPWLSITEIEPY